jgi:hypothetical protein
MKRLRMILLGLGAALALGLGCGPRPYASPVFGGDGLDAAKLPPEVRDDYGVFASRCSKCHALARSLNSGIDDDDFWKLYVSRMRRQPASGISPEDEVPILRFLHHYSLELKRAKAPKPESGLASPRRNEQLARGR